MANGRAGTAADTPSAGGESFASSPVHRFIGAELIDADHPERGVRFTVGPNTEGRPGTLNGGIISVLLDSAAYLALAPTLAAGETALSHDIHISLLRGVAVGQTVELVGRVVQQGRRVAFIDATASVEGRPVATARITKTVVQAQA
jgi:uncharacterized protein (TIGR00369 family)